VPTPQFADWLEAAKDASDRAAHELDARRRVVLARRAANFWECATRSLEARRGTDWWPDAAALLRRAADDWETAENPAHAAEARAHAARLDAAAGPGRLVYRGDPRPWTDPDSSLADVLDDRARRSAP